MRYDLESNIISWEITKKGKISHAIKYGNFIIHLSSSNTPILIEILNASSLLKRFNKVKSRGFDKVFSKSTVVSS